MKRTIVESLIQEVQIGEETIRIVYHVSLPLLERPGRGVVLNCQASVQPKPGQTSCPGYPRRVSLSRAVCAHPGPPRIESPARDTS